VTATTPSPSQFLAVTRAESICGPQRPAKPDGRQHSFELPSQFRIRVVLGHAGPRQQWRIADVDEGNTQNEVGLRSVALIGRTAGAGCRAAEGTIEGAFRLASTAHVIVIRVAGFPSTVILPSWDSSTPALVRPLRYVR
jgi:hypothetical protein